MSNAVVATVGCFTYASPSSFQSHAFVPFLFAAQVSSIPIVDDNDSLLDVYSRRSVLFAI